MPGPLIAPIPHLYTRWPPVAYQFVTSGSGAGIDFGSAAVLDNITVGKHTMAGWLAFDGSSLVGLNHNFWCKGGFASGLGWTVRMIADGLRLEHYTSSTTRRYDSSDTPLAVALNRRWMFLAVVADLSLGAGLKFRTYWAPHGEALKQGTTTVSNEGAGTSDTDAAQNLTLGVRDGGEIVAGWVHGPSAYWNDQVLGLADLQQWMLNPLALVGRPTVLAFPDPAADRFTDWSGNGQHATVSNGIFAGAPRWLAIDQGRRFWAVAITGGTQTVTVGIASETDTAPALTVRKVLAVGLASETDTALATTARKARAVGIVAETDTALGVTEQKARTVGLVTETDTALTLGTQIIVQVGLAAETDTAAGLTWRKLKAVGLTTETDSALAMTPAKRRTAGLANTTDTAFALGVIIKRRTVGLTTETDTALAVSNGAVVIPDIVQFGVATMTAPGLRNAALTVPGQRAATLLGTS